MTHTPVARSTHAKARKVDHRDGAGHLDRAYERGLRARVHAAHRSRVDRAFVRWASSDDASAEQSGEEFVMGATSGEEGGAVGLEEVSSEERGGPFIETSGQIEYAYDADATNPADGTREPFPTT
jgi:hypothetical protein